MKTNIFDWDLYWWISNSSELFTLIQRCSAWSFLIFVWTLIVRTWDRPKLTFCVDLASSKLHFVRTLLRPNSTSSKLHFVQSWLLRWLHFVRTPLRPNSTSSKVDFCVDCASSEFWSSKLNFSVWASLRPRLTIVDRPNLAASEFLTSSKLLFIWGWTLLTTPLRPNLITSAIFCSFLWNT